MPAKNVTSPTNLDVDDAVRDRFGRSTRRCSIAPSSGTRARWSPGAVVTEYAWQASTCDPCPGPTLGASDFMTLGAAVLEPAPIAAPAAGGGRPSAPPSSRPAPRRVPPGWGNDLVLTRLHARYGKDIKDIKDDLVFKAAPPIVGGREHVIAKRTASSRRARSPRA
ncbi:MAG TPA: hypothetical protein VNO30_14215 [Kofleriaceae bacterium]|nr:hypothetical protein [Kofleriaceae bacterium]